MIGANSRRISERLGALRLLSPDMDAAAVVSVEGVLLAASLPDDLEEERLAAMTAAMLALGERIAAELGRGELQEVFIKGRDGYVLLMPISETLLLTTLVSAEAKLGMALLDMERTIADLRGLLKPAAASA